MPGGERDRELAGPPMPVSLVCCGLFGALVSDGGMVDRAYSEAIATQGVVTGTAAYARSMALVHQARGQNAAEVLRAMFPDSQARGQAAYIALDRSFRDAIGRTGVTPVPGASAAIEKLTAAGVRVCVVTSFSRRILIMTLDTLGWLDRVGLALSADDVPRGFPWPDLILSAMLRLGVTDVREAAVAHDAEGGIVAGRRAGASLVAGVLNGVHSGERLKRVGATHLVPSIADLPDLLNGLRATGPPVPGAVPGPRAAAARPVTPAPADTRWAGTAEG